MTNALDRLTAPAQITQTTAVEQARAVAEVAAAVQVAQMNPRDVRRAWAEMEDACRRYELADVAFYKVPNRGRDASVHLARAIALIWGNHDSGVRELSRDDARGMSEIQAYAWDQQRNVRSSRTFQVPHAKMVKGERKKLDDLSDIYLNNQNIGARALRESIWATLPRDYVARAKEVCEETLQNGDGTPLLDRIEQMIAVFSKGGISAKQIEARLGKPRGQWTAVDVADMQVVIRSIARGETTAADEFPAERVTAAEITGQRPATTPKLSDPNATDDIWPAPAEIPAGDF
ncbi:hypothetical protein GCM10010168_86220 [Actinoplanes ianthinogenes]|uniref:Uncharacterized protein n=1 Tax=Actinoplanes ianthinogenes TaxID=122358 RepID=A0ABN6CK46_9ACTN|nr:hypothetical protein [Actinoplanes ianthinogenes]BCJ45353.1 hypothetical protein Aiant_60100 [Actinoplanes ianthinogenes]GGR53967.1 hypothetical protein GCM10010168_86220 [Actinoplanes ianthinogenes]